MPVTRIPHASHWGAYSILVEDGRITGVEPFAGDPDPSPIIRSVTGWADPARRIPRPMVREGWLKDRAASDRTGRGRERFVPVDWDTALALVAGEIDRVRTEHGNASIFAGSYGWTSCGRFHHAPTLLKRMLNLVGGYTGHVDTYSIAAGPVILRHVLGAADACQGGAPTLSEIAEHTKTLVVFGALAARTAQNEAGGIARHRLQDDLRKLVARGVRIVHVSPQRDDLPEWVGAEWWPVAPGTDAALLLALAGEAVSAGLHDRDFLDTRCSGAETFLDYLGGKGDGQPKTADWAAQITGLPAERIRALARDMAATRSFVTMSWSLQRARHGEQPFWAALGLAAVLGQIGLPGGGAGFGYGSLGGVGAPLPLTRSPAMSKLQDASPTFIPVARITDLLLNPGAPFDYEGRTHAYPDTRLVYWAGGNPFHHHQDLNRLERGWQRPETIVVQDPMWTPTALRADIVLPATTSIERNDIAGNRRSDTILAMKQAIAPLGEARSDYDIFSGLAACLGVAEAFTEGRDEMAWIRALYNESRNDAKVRFDAELPDFDTFWETGHADVPSTDDTRFLHEFRADPEAAPLKTESGRIVLGSDSLARWGYADCPPHPAWLPPEEWLGADRPGGADEVFHLLSPQPQGRLHSQLEQEPLSRSFKHGGRERLRMNPADAERLGIAPDQAVRVWNARGACLASAAPDPAIRAGVVILPTGAWFTPDDDGPELSGNPNVLTNDIPTSELGQGCAAQTCLVHVAPWNGNARDAAEAYHARMEALGITPAGG
ncbi:molybdopterin-dependent oxidoreductase [Acidimangrovimonas sediminis]|uniref:molybdopterin-dependent oxidoreductase n=1 Tax=Acidimangrovimonas sediminis TaxID=2056283 RepID=UPI000C7FDE08|nr:molybdopterin-dependent oxidoreductase [Acidimangrovimonas sediminis]